MTGHPTRHSLLVVALLVSALAGWSLPAAAATHTSKNFVVTASTDDIARRVANCAEYWRRELAIQWFNEPLPNWYRPCPISVTVGTMGASGQTTFTFENGEVHGWKMQVQGSMERVLDSVVPHEVNHTIFASYFRRPLPRWADEGAATLFEHESEQARQIELLNEVFQTPRRIPLKNLLTIREYPSDMRDVLTLYAEGFSLASFLVASKGDQGRKVYLQFLEDAHRHNWDKAITMHYGYQSIDHLEQEWSRWILAGSPALQPPGVQIASNSVSDAPPADSPAAEADPELVIRSQSPQLDSAPLFVASRMSDALPSVPRRLRAMDDGVLNSTTEPERLPRPTDTLSPTAEGIRTRAGAAQYSFPAARR